MNINLSQNVLASTLKSIVLVLFSYIQFKKDLHSKALSHEALPYFPKYMKGFLSNSWYTFRFQVIAEGSELCAYSKYNSQTERFSGLNLSSLAFFLQKPHYFVVIDRKVAVTLLLLELKYLSLLSRAKSSSDIFHLSNHLMWLWKLLKMSKNRNLKPCTKFSQQALNRIQYFSNSGTQDISISFANCVVLQKSVKLEGCEKIVNLSSVPHQVTSSVKSQNCNQRCLVFYLDNVSFETLDEIKDDKRYPNLNHILGQSEKITKSTSISNWTLPAAISMISALDFEEHKIFDPAIGPYWRIRSAIFNAIDANPLVKEVLFKTFPARFICGANWRLKLNHGHSATFTHSLTTHTYGDVYETLGQALKQLDIASTCESLHWINFMDSHHPVHGSVLPSGMIDQENKLALTTGYSYRTGPKDRASSSDSASIIYKAQLESVDKAIGVILAKSYSQIQPSNHTIVLISDHGTSFRSLSASQYGFDCEKFKAMYAIRTSRFSELDSSIIHDFRPSKILELIAMATFIGSSNDIKFFPENYSQGYSQVMYPGKISISIFLKMVFSSIQAVHRLN